MVKNEWLERLLVQNCLKAVMLLFCAEQPEEDDVQIDSPRSQAEEQGVQLDAPEPENDPVRHPLHM